MNKKIMSIALAGVVLAQLGQSINADEKKVERISGKDRIETSIEVSRYLNPKSKTVIITDAKTYPDALSASNLTVGKNPILLVKDGLTEKTIAEIKRLETNKVLIVGGESSISKKVEEELSKIQGVETVERISGGNRYETCQNTYDFAGKEGEVLASGSNFADALAVSPILGERGLLLADKNTKPEEGSVLVGGSSSISSEGLKDYERIAGSNRYETSVKLAKKLNSKTAIIVSGQSFPDALAASSLSQKLNCPILLSQKNSIDQSVLDYLRDAKIENVKIIGGEGSISAKVERDIKLRINPELVFKPRAIDEEVKKRIYGKSYKKNNRIRLTDLAYIPVAYKDFNNKLAYGEIIVNKKVGWEVGKIFEELYNSGIQIEKIRLIDEYGGNDVKSMEDNNTSAFNYRVIRGTNRLSKHSLGYAIDINTLYNPHVVRGVANPRAAQKYVRRDRNNPHMIFRNDKTYNIFKKYGWKWGGNWRYPDYQHFEK